MVRVPGNPGPQVSLNPLPDVRHQAFPSPWSALSDAVNRTSEVVEQAEITRVEDAINRVRVSSLDLQNDAYSQVGENVRPKDGKTFTDQYMQKFSELASQEGATLSSDRQKVLYQKRVGMLGTMFQAGVNEHERKQLLAGNLKINESTREIESQAAAKNLDDKKGIALSRARVDESIASDIDMQKLDPATAQVYRQAKLTGFHGSILESALLAGRVDYASAYYDAHKEEIAPEARGKIETAIAKRGVDVTSDKMANEIWSSLGPKNDTDATNLDAMVKAIPESVSPEVRKQVRNGLKELASDRDYSVNKREDSRMSRFVKEIEGGKSWRDIKNDPEFRELSGTKQDDLHKTFEDKYKPKEGARNANLYNDLLKNPAVLGMMSEEAIIALTPMIGKTYRDDLLSVKKRLSGKPATQNVLNDALNHFGQKQGYLVPRGDKLVPKDPSEWAEIQYKVNQRLANDKAESEADISNVVRSVMARATIKVHRSILPDTTESKRISAMSNAELDAAVAVVSPKDLEVISDALARQGIYHPTKRQILEAQAALLMEE